jgi:hypothetical protein
MGRKRRGPYEAPKDYGYRFKDPNAEWRLSDSARTKLPFIAVWWTYIVIFVAVALMVGNLIAHC